MSAGIEALEWEKRRIELDQVGLAARIEELAERIDEEYEVLEATRGKRDAEAARLAGIEEAIERLRDLDELR